MNTKEAKTWLQRLYGCWAEHWGRNDDLDQAHNGLFSVVEERDALKAEVELLSQNAMLDYAAHLELKARAEKAEARLAKQAGKSMGI